MQNLAVGVGDLKKVLSNVKTRGILGEIQLDAILKEILAPDQYEVNVATVPNSKNRVEFAVKLPGEERGYTRFRFLSELLAREGFEVDLITSTFQHWNKEQRDTTLARYQGLPYRIRFVYEPGYKRNLDPARINSHRIFARNLKGLFKSRFS